MMRKFLAVMIGVITVIPGAAGAEPVIYNFREPTPSNAALHSLILPGWGQHFNGQTVKGYVVGGATAVSIAAACLLARRADATYEDYEKQGIRDSSLYSDYEAQSTQSNAAAVLAAGLWVYGVVDAYVVAKRQPAPEASLHPEGINLAWGKRDLQLVYRKKF